MAGLPAINKTEMCQISTEQRNAVVALVNTSGADLALNDFAVIDKAWCGVVNQDSLNTEPLYLTVEDGLQVLTNNIAAAATFGASGDKVFWNPTLKEFTDISAVGHFLVGYTFGAKDVDDLIKFEKFRRPVEILA